MSPSAIAIALGALAILAGVSALIASRLASRVLVTRRVEGALEVPGSRAVAGCLALALLPGLGLGPAALVAVLGGDGGVQTGKMAGASLLLSALAVPVVVQMVLGRWSLHRLRLTHAAIEVRGFRTTTTVPWEDLVGVVRLPGRWGPWVLQLDEGAAIPLRTGFLHGGVQVVDLLEDYRRNPWKRRALRHPLP